MISRYTKPEMGKLWTLENKFQKMLDVEVAVASVQAQLGIIPKKAATEIRKKSKFSVARIEEIEKTTKHDVIAFVSNVAENVGDYGRYIHYGLTSSDVLDTALSLQIVEAGQLILVELKNFEEELAKVVKKHELTICSGRTHGMHAEPTTFGFKMAGFLAEIKRNRERLVEALDQIKIGKLSGAVGTYSAQSIEVEEKVCQKLKLVPETLATQVVPRDRHAQVVLTLSLIGCAIERLSVELRHLQRTEVGEVYEGFSRGQKGSSAMPHKKNPISSENLTGVSRLLRSYSQAALEDIALWHERDISHSSVERVIFPDAFILCHYAIVRMTGVVKNLKVDSKRMKKNMDNSQGQLFSSHVLLALVKKGLSREEAYSMVQRISHSLEPDQNLKDAIKTDSEASALLKKSEVDQIFKGESHQKQILKIIKKVVSNRRR